MDSKLSAVVLAAGTGSRMNLDVTKQRIEIANESVLSRAVAAFQNCTDVSEIIVVVRSEELEYAKNLLSQFCKVKDIVVGGSVRSESAKIGFEVISDLQGYVAIHDAARCLVTPDMISSVFRDAIKYGAATASTIVSDTVKMVDSDGFITKTISRKDLRLMQTPQIFRKSDYKKALASLNEGDEGITDDNMLLERIGVRVFCTETGKKNMKITLKEDIEYARFLLEGEHADV